MRQHWISHTDPVAVVRQCACAGVWRAMVYPKKNPQPVNAFGLRQRRRIDEEIRRRERVIRIFPNDDSARRAIGALLPEQNDGWQERRYLNMERVRRMAGCLL